jgi:hypothetical protein
LAVGTVAGPPGLLARATAGPPQTAPAHGPPQAQQNALVSCIEEGERSRLGLSSPQGVLRSPSNWRSEATEELEREGSEAGSSSNHASATPVARRLAPSLAGSPGDPGSRGAARQLGV